MPAASTATARAKRGRPTAVERERRHTRILDAAVAAFGRAGFERTSLDDIADAAAVTKRTLYVDVGDKAALFAAAVEREHQRIRDAASVTDSALDVAAELVHVLHSDAAIGLHRAVIAEAVRQPLLAEAFYTAGPRHSIGLLAERFGIDAERASALYTLLLGEPHRRRLLGLDPAPSRAQSATQARAAWALLAP
ncbi:TetR/AcrR family transcriptional regulator [Herbiconiux sp. 11R-BC]|uniref:TetR/AcrR family transcriptional regulator n=1 Tax=Herbiconiux sp. 11R-BC TaxID=3111637 RepID=UPI003C00ABBF